MGYCPFCVVRLYCKEGLKERKWYCNTVIVLQRRKLGGLDLSCNTLECIAIEAAE